MHQPNNRWYGDERGLLLRGSNISIFDDVDDDGSMVFQAFGALMTVHRQGSESQLRSRW